MVGCISDIRLRALRLPGLLVRAGRERWGWGRRERLGREVVDEGQDLRLAVLGPWARTRMSLDHPLRRQKRLDFLSQFSNAVVLPHPVGSLGTKAQALETQAYTGLASAVVVGLLVAFLSANSAGVTARLCSDGAFWLRRSGFLLRLLLGAGVCRDGGHCLPRRGRRSVRHGGRCGEGGCGRRDGQR